MFHEEFTLSKAEENLFPDTKSSVIRGITHQFHWLNLKALQIQV
jgi:hypothetical protein